MAPQQWMTDPLWQFPRHPCKEADGTTDWQTGDQWFEDDGTGHGDDTTPSAGKYYYPQRPWEEARATVPSGAPGLPSGCVVGVMPVATINTYANYPAAMAAHSSVGYVQQPPAQGSCWMPWWTWAANRLANVLASGRFSCDYADPLAVCADDIEIEP
jgi:hypothetical protein